MFSAFLHSGTATHSRPFIARGTVRQLPDPDQKPLLLGGREGIESIAGWFWYVFCVHGGTSPARIFGPYTLVSIPGDIYRRNVEKRTENFSSFFQSSSRISGFFRNFPVNGEGVPPPPWDPKRNLGRSIAFPKNRTGTGLYMKKKLKKSCINTAETGSRQGN